MENSENKTKSNKSAALIIIGNEILSGRTLDKNTQYIGQACADYGVALAEVRVVPDIEARIVGAVNEMRAEYDYVFTTGGIGPTHDDITAVCVARAFGAGFGRHVGAYEILLAHYGAEELNEARASMADMPIYEDLDLILNPVSAAPGFRIENVFVMAGVPRIMQAMFDHVLEMVEGGAAMVSRTVFVDAPESHVAVILSDVQDAYKDVDIGSYPKFKADGGWSVSVVLRGVDVDRLKVVEDALVSVLGENDVPVQIFE
ncbi:MAG: competence/damage-inducible protein A [Alphaproteobacteria bacterium]